MSGNFTVNSKREIEAIDNPLEAHGQKKNDKETKIFEKSKECSEVENVNLVECSLKKKHKFTFGSIRKFFEYIWKKNFSQKTPTYQEVLNAKSVVSTQPIEKILLTNEQYVDVLGKIAEKMLKDNLWEVAGCFRTQGDEKTVREAQTKLYTACKDQTFIQLDDAMSSEDCATLFKRCFREFSEKNLSENDFLKKLKGNKDAWENITTLLKNVASSKKTLLNPETLGVAFPSASCVIRTLFPSS